MLLKTLNKLIEENNIDPEEFAKDPYGVIDRLEDEGLKWLLLMDNGDTGLITTNLKKIMGGTNNDNDK